MNLAKLQEAIAAAIPDTECIIFGQRRFTWAQFNDRTRRLGAYMKQHGLGLHQERSELEAWQSGQDHIALYLYNCNEYLEALLGAFKCRAAAINVNYRYKGEELVYLLKNSGARAIIFHARFAEMLQALRDQLPEIKVWIQVADDSNAPLMAGAVEYEAALASVAPEPGDPKCSDDDLFIIYTGGTTGMPKGVLWRQTDIFFGLIAQTPVGTTQDETVADVHRRVAGGRLGKAMPLAPMMHASGTCMALGAMFRGSAIVIQDTVDHFDAEEIVSIFDRERITQATLIGDAFALPLLAEMDRGDYDLSAMSMINSGGAVLSPRNKERLQEHMPEMLLVDAVGSSEAGRQAMNFSKGGKTKSSVDFSMDENARVISADRSRILHAGDEEAGWVAQREPVAMGYLNDREKTATSFPTIDGERYAVPGDRARMNDDGSYHFLGRDSVTINSGGEKIFAEEVEVTLKSLRGILDATVVGIKDDAWGQKVVAIVSTTGDVTISEDQAREHCKAMIASYKAPKNVIFVDEVYRAANGKASYEWARDVASKALSEASS
ncbi:MAG: AMP-binding protein [Rhodospirillaceae bacterium]|nr:AMP-binding protein [Rhodospirillaceae bacterium]MBT4689092.1 AMP-binding protein [Rhodospirillaceae bacterium]MBT5082083.1 AMP-binding protein [Rhodospirillaceae bacterium]MBT5523556.1 AMP-binding protein [Rhodospirillaceae bacterium]MBT5878999.1 AMP-binding protein [Rhodospirillaceae bacterium]